MRERERERERKRESERERVKRSEYVCLCVRDISTEQPFQIVCN